MIGGNLSGVEVCELLQYQGRIITHQQHCGTHHSRQFALLCCRTSHVHRMPFGMKWRRPTGFFTTHLVRLCCSDYIIVRKIHTETHLQHPGCPLSRNTYEHVLVISSPHFTSAAAQRAHTTPYLVSGLISTSTIEVGALDHRGLAARAAGGASWVGAVVIAKGDGSLSLLRG